MAQKWYSKATVQAALIGGIFLLAASLITVIMNKSNTIDKNKIISSNTNLNTNSNSNDILNIPDSLKTKNSSNEYELIFVIDITASTQPFIDGLAKSIVDLRNTLSSSYKDINLKIGVIIFRDYISNQSVMGLPFEIYTELSSDLSLVYQKLDTLREDSLSREEFFQCLRIIQLENMA